MKRRLFAITLVTCLFAGGLSGCMNEVPVEKNLPSLQAVSGSVLESSHNVEGFQFVTRYDTGKYDLGRWRITDSKMIDMSAILQNVPSGTDVQVEHVHIDMSLKSTNPQLDGLGQDSMDDQFHGNTQDGFEVSEKYPYKNQFAVEGFSKDLIEDWGFVCGTYGYLSDTRLTEKSLVTYGKVYANKMQVVYDLLIKNKGDKFYHVLSVTDEFLIPVPDSNVQN